MLSADRQRFGDPLALVIFGVLPLGWIVCVLVLCITSDTTGFDLRGAFLPAAHHVFHGVSPYPSAGDPSLSHQTAYVYPPLTALLLVPLTALPVKAALGLWMVATALLVPATLAVAGVRDRRCWAVALFWAPVYNAIHDATISVFLAFLLAVAWRLRGSERVSGALLGVLAAVKLFTVPVLVWPLAVGRRRLAASAVVCGAVLIFGSWAVIGFADITSYPSLLRKLTDLEERDSYSLSGALGQLGLGTSVARALAITAGLGLLGLALWFGRRRDEERAFVAAVLASLALTPILWQHYLAALLVTLAVLRPRLSPVWFVPMLLWVAPFTGNGALWQTVAVPLLAGAAGAVSLLPRKAGASFS